MLHGLLRCRNLPRDLISKSLVDLPYFVSLVWLVLLASISSISIVRTSPTVSVRKRIIQNL